MPTNEVVNLLFLLAVLLAVNLLIGKDIENGGKK